MGFNAKWGVLGAADVGANHQRDRIWIVANSNHARTERGQQQSQISNSQRNLANATELFSNGGNHNARVSMERQTQSQFRNDCGSKNVAEPKNTGLERRENGRNVKSSKSRFGESSWSIKDNWVIEPNVGRVANGVAARVDRLKAIGNGQVPLCAATAWQLLSK
jgi:DNA (cytosine-5)-methyltransferase 1